MGVTDVQEEKVVLTWQFDGSSGEVTINEVRMKLSTATHDAKDAERATDLPLLAAGDEVDEASCGEILPDATVEEHHERGNAESKFEGTEGEVKKAGVKSWEDKEDVCSMFVQGSEIEAKFGDNFFDAKVIG